MCAYTVHAWGLVCTSAENHNSAHQTKQKTQLRLHLHRSQDYVKTFALETKPVREKLQRRRGQKSTSPCLRWGLRKLRQSCPLHDCGQWGSRIRNYGSWQKCGWEMPVPHMGTSKEAKYGINPSGKLHSTRLLGAHSSLVPAQGAC